MSITYRYLPGGKLLDIAKGETITLAKFAVGDRGRGKKNMILATTDDGEKLSIARKHIDESAETFGPGAINTMPQGGGEPAQEEKPRPKVQTVRIPRTQLLEIYKSLQSASQALVGILVDQE